MIYKKIQLKGDQKIFFTSDTHYGHKNICRGTSEWDLDNHGGHTSVRDFDTLEDMNQTIVDNINNHVGEDDYLVHLGDFSFGGIENIWNFRKHLNVKDITFVLGNHDHHIANNKELPNCWIRYKDGEYVDLENSTSDWDDLVNSQELFSSVHSYLEITVSGDKYKKRTYNLSHFPFVMSDKQHHGRIGLHGHTHSSFIHDGRSLDVGIDMAYKLFGEYRPFTIEDIDTYMEGRTYPQLSHHNKNTN